MKNIWSIVNAAAWKHGISNPKILEGGFYHGREARVLRRMQKKYLKSLSGHDFHLYIQQKARFLTGKR